MHGIVERRRTPYALGKICSLQRLCRLISAVLLYLYATLQAMIVSSIHYHGPYIGYIRTCVCFRVRDLCGLSKFAGIHTMNRIHDEGGGCSEEHIAGCIAEISQVLVGAIGDGFARTRSRWRL